MTTRSILEPITINAESVKNLDAVLNSREHPQGGTFNGEIMTINDLSLEQIVKYNGYNFRVTGFRYPDMVYIKPIGIAKKIYRGEITVKITELER